MNNDVGEETANGQGPCGDLTRAHIHDHGADHAKKQARR